jgi:aryl-alcohol dehydrogenase-like predicted oxidoreductase
VLDACRQLGVTLIAYMPLASGALTGKYSATTRPAGWRRYTRPFRGKNLAALTGLIDLLREVGNRHDRSPGQVALRWLLQQEGVLPIPGAKTAGQATHNAGALTFSLEEAEIDALDRTTKAARP